MERVKRIIAVSRFPFRFPIPLKLLVGFAANLLLLAVGFFWVFRAQFGSATNELFTSIAEPRVQAVAQRIGEDLRAASREDWDRILREASTVSGVEFSLFDGTLLRVAGPLPELPPELEAEIRRNLIRGGPPRRRFEDGPREEFDRPPPPEDDFHRPPPPHGGGPPPRHDQAPPMDPAGGSYPKMTARSEDPPAYWVLSMVPVVETHRGYLPLILVMRSDSLTGHGVFFDPKPWIISGLGVLLISGLIWVPLAISLTSSLRRIRSATGRIAEGDFAVSVPDAMRADELGDLGRSVQVMAQRLEAHVAGQKRFLGDIAHELCSPISRLQAVVGILEEGGGSAEARDRHLRRIGVEVQQMSALVNELLSFSKASLRREVSVVAVDVAGLIQGVLDREEASSDQVRVQIPPGLEVRADPELLDRAVGNLVRNALRYAVGSGPIEISAERTNHEVILRIGDSGPGVPEESLPKLFEPFYRPDASRTRDSGGTGLGLAIVKTCIEACGGSVTASLREPTGLEVALRLDAVEGE